MKKQARTIKYSKPEMPSECCKLEITTFRWSSKSSKLKLRVARIEPDLHRALIDCPQVPANPLRRSYDSPLVLVAILSSGLDRLSASIGRIFAPIIVIDGVDNVQCCTLS
jgi:hypothetical protein